MLKLSTVTVGLIRNGMTSLTAYPLFSFTAFPQTLFICSLLISPFFAPGLFHLPVSSGLTFSVGPHMEHQWAFFVEEQDKIHSTTRCSLTVPACAAQFVFKWIAEKTWWPFAQHIYQPLPPAATSTILPSTSIIFILSFTLFLFLYFLLGLWTKHGARCHCKACLLPSQVLSVRSSAPLRATQSFSSVQLFCSLQKGLHLALVFFKPPLSTAPFLLVLPTPPSLRKKEVNADVGPTWAHCSFSLFLVFSPTRSLFLAFFFFFYPTDPHGWSSGCITHWTHWHSEPHSGGCPSQ